MNKRKIHAEYMRRIHRTIEYISANLDKSLNLEEVAGVSHFSPFHFHRIFHGLMGETLNDYIIRRRMETAANRLVCLPGASITEISELGGFSSSANFARAFRAYFGVSPSQVRNPEKAQNSKIGKLYRKYGKEFDPRNLYPRIVTDPVIFEPDEWEEMMMNVKVREMGERQVAYLTAPGGYDLESIFATWDKVIGWAKSSGVQDLRSRRFAICHDNPMVTPVEKCRYDASVLVEEGVEVPAPFSKTSIPAGKYAVAYFKGDGDKVSSFYMELYSSWLPGSGYEPDHFPPVAHYLNDSREDGFVEMEVHIKVKALGTASS